MVISCFLSEKSDGAAVSATLGHTSPIREPAGGFNLSRKSSANTGGEF